MPRTIIKLADEEYVEWSTIVDAPVTDVMTREELEAHLIHMYGEQEREKMPARIGRADITGTSMLGGYTKEGMLSCNRAGEGETHLTVDEIRERYKPGADADTGDPPETIRKKFYLHGDKDSRWSEMEEDADLKSLQMTEEAQDVYKYTGYEVEFDCEVHRSGEVYATHVNKVRLEKPIKI